MGEPQASKRPWIRKVARGAALYAGIPLALLFLFVVIFEDSFIYFPGRYPDGDWRTSPSPFPLEDVELTTADGVKIHGWYAHGAGATWTVLLLHGNGGHLADRRGFVAQFVRYPADVLVIDYRGYGRSEGKPSEEGLYADAMAAYDYLTKTRGVAPERIALYGESLGAAVAIELATRVPVGRLILQGAFTNIKEMSGRVIPLIPVHWMMRHRYDNLAKVPKIAVPKLHIHGTSDEVIPFDQGRRLFEAAASPKEFYEIPGAGHNDLVALEGSRFDDRLKAFLGR